MYVLIQNEMMQAVEFLGNDRFWCCVITVPKNYEIKNLFPVYISFVSQSQKIVCIYLFTPKK